jgi:hypothetical protein
MEMIQTMEHAVYSKQMISMDNEKNRLLYASYIPETGPGAPDPDSKVQVLRLKRSEYDPFIFEVLKGKDVLGDGPVHMKDLLALNGVDAPRAMFHVTMGCGKELRDMQEVMSNDPSVDVESAYLSMMNPVSDQPTVGQDSLDVPRQKEPEPEPEPRSPKIK